jgi:ParB/RepB/Spo0J family partition protein
MKATSNSQPLCGGKDKYVMATSTVLGTEEIFHIPLTDIQLSKTNPRRDFDSQALEELATDVAKRGVQEPVLVRPIPGSETKFELVFGERHYKASQKAGRETIRAMKREISDEEAEDLQIMENLQREDLSCLDEAAAFKRLFDRQFTQTSSHDDAIAFVVATVNKKPKYVIQRLKIERSASWREGRDTTGQAPAGTCPGTGAAAHGRAGTGAEVVAASPSGCANIRRLEEDPVRSRDSGTSAVDSAKPVSRTEECSVRYR